MAKVTKTPKTQTNMCQYSTISPKTDSAATANPAQPLAPTRTEAWLSAGTQASSAQAVWLGPEPILTPTRITLSVGAKSLTIATDGLKPFEVRP